MSQKLGPVSRNELTRFIGAKGFFPVRRKGSHETYRNSATGVCVTIPRKREIGKGLLAAILRQAGLEKEEFLKYQKR